ncbi:MYCBP-associated protein [Centropristis striata]|uniref:MYCBP-associated protein n=1 Tax=Centropristis striata TaxID=184440 RepID=UPI0027DFA619|nr:MYCBP-associated protein [Centropristis striata]
MLPQDLHKLHIPKPPGGHQPAALCRTADGGGPAGPGSVILDSQDHTGRAGLRFDGRGMVLPHSILGTLEDFRSYLEAKGDTELMDRLPKAQRNAPSEPPGGLPSEAEGSGVSAGHRNTERNALQHWNTHMTQRRRQQDFLSELLARPVGGLLMNQASSFRGTQEQRELLNQVMPLLHSGYGYRVGSEFWSLPQRYGDEMSGITATLTQTEQGRRQPLTHVGQPGSIRRESGLTSAGTRPASLTWDQSRYLQQQNQELREFLQDMDINKPDMDGLEVIGSSKPFTSITVCCGPVLEEEEEEEEKMKKENLDPLAQFDDVQSDLLLIPALRFCGQLATWTGNSTSNQGEAGISATMLFEALTGERASSHLELHNEGSTAIFYSWQQLLVPQSFPELRPQTKSLFFYFSSSSGVIRPGDTQRVDFIFKSEEPGIRTELWQLTTHPVLLQGASMQLTLKGVALSQDQTADQRLFIETKLEKVVKVKLCRSIVSEVLRGVCSPERPSSPAELHLTEEQQFLSKNSELQFLHQPVEELKRLWEEVYPGCTWDLSVDSLRQAVLSLPEHESVKEESLARLNVLLLQLSGPGQLQRQQITAAAAGQQLWRKLLDSLAGEALRLRDLLGLPERETWSHHTEEALPSDADMAENKEEKSDKKGGAAPKEERSGVRSRFKDDNKESKSATTERSAEDSRKKGRRREDVGKRCREKQGKELSSPQASLTDLRPDSVSQPPDEEHGELMDIYTRLLHKKVYSLMGELVDNLCDLMDELHKGDEHY